jgi:flagellar biosynthetic protein FliP
MKGRSAAERIAIHLAILFALAVPVSARGLQAPSIARQLKTEGGETESFTTPSASTRNNSTTTRAIIKLKAPVASPASQSIGSLKLPGMGNEQVPWSIVVLLTTLTLIPSILVCMTPFARILIVFHFLRQALGLQTTPSNQTLIGLSLILTFFLMQPVAANIYQTAIVPMQAGQITAMEAVNISKDPIRHFMGHYVREKDLALFLELAKEPTPASMNDVSLRVMLPAYILSELKAGFQIGAVLFLPFLIVDMVVASITTSVGMLQLPPVVISTPLKLLLFLMVDGWHLLIGSLMRSFY